MELSFEYWYLLPASILIATLAMTSGIGGAVFFSPLFMLALKLDPKIAIGSAIFTELFGFSSGLIAYFKLRLIDFKLVGNLIIFSIPAAVLGTLYSDLVPAIILKSIFAAGLIFIGIQIFTSWRKEERVKHEMEYRKEFQNNWETELIDRDNRVFHYTVCNKNMGRGFAAIGGIFVGMISVGLAELQEYHLVARCKIPTPVAIATSIFVVVVTMLIASAGHFYNFVSDGSDVLNEVFNIVIFTIPGVIIGGQIGPKIQHFVPENKMKVAISLLFTLIGVFLFYTLI